MTEESKPLKVSIVKSPDYKAIYSTGVFGSLTPEEGRMIFYLDHPIPIIKDTPPGSMGIGGFERELQIEIRMSTAQWIGMMEWMQHHVEDLKKKGILETVEEVKSE